MDPYAAAPQFGTMIDDVQLQQTPVIMGPCFRRGDDGCDALLRIRISNSAFSKHSFAISPHDPREFCLNLPPSEIRGRGECRAPGAPAAARVV